MADKSLELYVHIPFCVRKCEYCDFLSAPAGADTQQEYVRNLLLEIEQKGVRCTDYEVTTIFFGGGTPSILKAGWIADILNAIHRNFKVRKDAEIAIECNPGTLTFEKLSIYKSAGINRISVGLQSASDAELRELGRIHTYEDFLKSYDLIRKKGFSNVNIDLMAALPGQTLKSYEQTLRRVLALKPEHISAYSLIIEEGTPFYEKYEADELLREKGEKPQMLPSEETERLMYERTKELLLAHGYERYEISNYARRGYACRHNIGYWRRENYLGFGLGSASLLENERFHNTTDLTDYLGGDYLAYEQEKLDKKSQMEEFMFLGLRMTDGISTECFRQTFGLTVELVYGPVLEQQIADQLLRKEDGRIFLTERGLDVSNYVMAQFLLDK
ncbi:oxygen-independent coproporphyrinogen III oxidase [Roseburia sp. BX0805]|uniref:Heme chaperone HemW n=1 Tax=Roseburia yibonii TaxID=2763063 RepID=A0ABR7I6C2_9FIRM|nr:radical SAM family heme chaperone HemW [Roseburia yibonii]MBC5752468.1 oxygen-independent coproporphyrinogen III oxidase [Roseburia yibonii]